MRVMPSAGGWGGRVGRALNAGPHRKLRHIHQVSVPVTTATDSTISRYSTGFSVGDKPTPVVRRAEMFRKQNNVDSKV